MDRLNAESETVETYKKLAGMLEDVNKRQVVTEAEGYAIMKIEGRSLAQLRATYSKWKDAVDNVTRQLAKLPILAKQLGWAETAVVHRRAYLESDMEKLMGCIRLVDGFLDTQKPIQLYGADDPTGFIYRGPALNKLIGDINSIEPRLVSTILGEFSVAARTATRKLRDGVDLMTALKYGFNEYGHPATAMRMQEGFAILFLRVLEERDADFAGVFRKLRALGALETPPSKKFYFVSCESLF